MHRLVAQRCYLGGIIGRVHKVRRLSRPSGSPTESPPGSHASTQTSLQLMGIAIGPTCSLYPIQEVVWPLAPALGADIAGLRQVRQHLGRLIVSCRSSRLGSFARASPLRGRPRLRRFGFAAFGFGPPISRASIAVGIPRDRQDGHLQRLMRRLARPLSASEKARENVASLGSRRAPSRHSLPINLKTLAGRRRRNVEHGLAMKARASAARSWFRTLLPGRGSSASTRTSSRTATNSS